MPTKTKFGLKGKDRDSYLALVLAFPLASIKSEQLLLKYRPSRPRKGTFALREEW